MRTGYNTEWDSVNCFKVFIAFTNFESNKTGINLFVGTHNKTISEAKIKVLEESNLAQSIELNKMSTLILNANTIHQIFRKDARSKMRFIELKYSC